MPPKNIVTIIPPTRNDACGRLCSSDRGRPGQGRVDKYNESATWSLIGRDKVLHVFRYPSTCLLMYPGTGTYHNFPICSKIRWKMTMEKASECQSVVQTSYPEVGSGVNEVHNVGRCLSEHMPILLNIVQPLSRFPECVSALHYSRLSDDQSGCG